MKKKLSWEKNYKNKRFNKYPFDFVISYTKKYIKNKNINSLDLGCGGGNNTKFLQDEGFNVFGVDSSDTSIKLTRSIIKSKFKKQIIKCDFKNLHYEESFFDLIIDRMSITHNDENNVTKILDEVYRVTNKNGIIISSFHSNKNAHLKFGTKKNNFKYTYFNFDKGDFKYSPVVFAPNKKYIKKIFSKFTILELIENNQKNILDETNFDNKVYFVVVAKKL